jgi:hypothetical protein
MQVKYGHYKLLSWVIEPPHQGSTLDQVHVVYAPSNRQEVNTSSNHPTNKAWQSYVCRNVLIQVHGST